MLKKINKISLLLILFLTLCLNISFAEDQIYTFKSKNTDFIGSVAKEKDGSKTISFVGIPFAKPPVDDLRWKAPREIPSSNVFYPAKEVAVYRSHQGMQVLKERE